ncbi:NADH dehydrogenase subunit 6 (mitochondrion) [Liolophura japonica]|uniref:NADH dehydrogenase subunit 6 n=1 Tax=Liolophura japonica TaxID=13599 RepID=UPI0023D87823|nr:NADH dehydrogenase subunit 6 [Liolophura japonica]WDQ44251.1 NADH dehydrogenase subunit 6 [Liolophura japonica]
MTMLSLFSLILSIGFILPMVSQPLSMGSLILINSFMISICVFFESGSWFGFILFLIYIGGLLVMFAYVTALTPNLVFKKGSLKFGFFLMYFFWVSLFLCSSVVGIPGEVESLSLLWEGGYHKQGMSLFSFFGGMTASGLVLILLFILLCVVKVCYKSKGALRPYK